MRMDFLYSRHLKAIIFKTKLYIKTSEMHKMNYVYIFSFLSFIIIYVVRELIVSIRNVIYVY